jgi:hypothetical protein
MGVVARPDTLLDSVLDLVVGYRQGRAGRMWGVSVAWYSERTRRLKQKTVVELEVRATEIVKRRVSEIWCRR